MIMGFTSGFAPISAVPHYCCMIMLVGSYNIESNVDRVDPLSLSCSDVPTLISKPAPGPQPLNLNMTHTEYFFALSFPFPFLIIVHELYPQSKV